MITMLGLINNITKHKAKVYCIIYLRVFVTNVRKGVDNRMKFSQANSFYFSVTFKLSTESLIFQQNSF